MTKIEFLFPPDLLGRIPAPQPAAKFLPEWFRDLDREMEMKDAHGLPGLTVRACLPVADVMAQGWIIPTPFDIWTVVEPQTRAMEFRWASDLPFAAFNGTVDCDALDVPVNVPFLWTSTRGALRMPAGTPMVQVIPFERAAQMRQAEVRAETAGEQARRQAANSRKHSEESVYAREWRRRHEKSPSG
jgi:hypothetical protein